MAGAFLGLLQYKFQAIDRRQRFAHPLGLVANDQQLSLRLQAGAASQHPFDQGGTGQGLEHLGQLALHAGALPGGQHGNGEHRDGSGLAGI